MILPALLVIFTPTIEIVAAASPTPATSFKTLLEAASKEGKLDIWYSTPSEAKTWDALKEAFQKRFNLKVDLTRTIVFSTDQPARLAAEGRTRAT